MNAAKAIELSLSAVLLEHANLPEAVMIRCWQTLDADPKWSRDNDRYFPLVELRAQPAVMDANERTMRAPCSIMVATKTEDDPSHEEVSDLYTKVENAIYGMYGQFMGAGSGAILSTYLAELASRTVAGQFNFAGLTLSDAIIPFDDNGVNAIGMQLTTHYTREDF
jgi:hypothetical protein